MTVINLDCRLGMQMLADNSIDAIVTDPPYELGFMGKAWDASGIAYDVEVWREALRVLKPGGHLLAFGGSRTYHRMTCAIEDAGFEIRDQIMWVYGSGFPKSLDVSKAIDKRGGNAELTSEIGVAIKAARQARGLSVSDCDRLFCGGTTNWSWFEGRSTGQRAPSPETFAAIAATWPELAPLAEAVAEAERGVIGQRTTGIGTGGGNVAIMGDGSRDITAPATDAARQWQGWGTALKPSHEPICVARKPLVGTVAANVLQHGTGALNIDGCRAHSHDSAGYAYTVQRMAPGADQNKTGKTHQNGVDFEGHTKDGRWPANLIHDGSDEVRAAFPSAPGQQGDLKETNRSRPSSGRFGDMAAPHAHTARAESDKSAARFFYCAKANKADRGEGNTHPTVKPQALMRYLCRLITPPGGTVLDIFTGSGSTGVAAKAEGFAFIGFESDADSVAIANRRIQA